MHLSVAGRRIGDFVRLLPHFLIQDTNESEDPPSCQIFGTPASSQPFREDEWWRVGGQGGVTNRTRWLLWGSDHVTPGDIERFLSAALSPWIWGYNMAFVVMQHREIQDSLIPLNRVW